MRLRYSLKTLLLAFIVIAIVFACARYYRLRSDYRPIAFSGVWQDRLKKTRHPTSAGLSDMACFCVELGRGYSLMFRKPFGANIA